MYSNGQEKHAPLSPNYGYNCLKLIWGFMCVDFSILFSVVNHLSHGAFCLCLHREDACVSGRSLGGPRRPTAGGGGLGSAQPECREPPRTLSQRYEHVESSLQTLLFSHTKHSSCLFVLHTFCTTALLSKPCRHSFL